MNETRSKLLENFDAAVADKLRTNQTKSREFLSRVEQILWRLTRHILDDRAFFPGEDHAFVLASPPYEERSNKEIPLGRYELTREEEHAHRYRLHHPLARAVIDEARRFECGPATIRFDYSATPGQSVDLAPLVGQSGTLRAAWLSVQTGGEGEDHLLLAGFTDSGESLSEEQCHRILDLPGQLASAAGPDSTQENQAGHAVETTRARTLEEIAARHAAAFEQEIDKLEHWAEDRKASLELELKELDAKIREANKESKIVSALDEKVKWQQAVRKLERQRAERRRDIFEAQDAVEDKRDELLEDAEDRLTKHLEEYPLFSIRWEVV